MLTKVLVFYDEFASVMNDFQEEELGFACAAAQPADHIETADDGCCSFEFHTQTGKYKHKLKLFNFTEKTVQNCNRINL